MDWYDLLYNPVGLALPFFVIGAIVGAIKAKRRGEGPVWVVLSALIVGFITLVAAAVLIFVAVMVLWGLSV